MIGHGALMLFLGMAVCALASVIASLGSSSVAYTVAVVLSALGLIFTAVYFTAVAIRERSRSLLTLYLAVMLLSIVGWALFWLMRSAPVDLRLLRLLAGAQGVVWSMWYVRLAFHLKAYPRKAAFLCILAATTSFLGTVLATQPQPSQLSAVATLSYYSMLIGMQILLTATYLHRELETTEESLYLGALDNRGSLVAREHHMPISQGISIQPDAQ
jgi:hypothetical protein